MSEYQWEGKNVVDWKTARVKERTEGRKTVYRRTRKSDIVEAEKDKERQTQKQASSRKEERESEAEPEPDGRESEIQKKTKREMERRQW